MMKKRLILLIMAALMMLSLCTAAFATENDNPVRTMVESISGVSSITVGGSTAYYEKDGSEAQIYIRALVSGGSEYGLKHATVTLNLTSSDVTVNGEINFSGSGTIRTATDVDLLNKAYTVTIDGTDYILAAGLPSGTVSIAANDPLAVTAATIGGANATITATNIQNPYMGNSAQATKWTFVNYKLNASMTGTDINRADVTAIVTAPSGASYSGCYNDSTHKMNLSAGAPKFVLTNGGENRTYYVFATSPGTVTVQYGIDFTEALNSTQYANNGEIAEAVDDLILAAENSFGAGEDGSTYGTLVVMGGTTVMDIMHEFAEANNWSDEVPEGCTYMATLNGIGEFDFGQNSGWMYTDDPDWDEAETNNEFYEDWNTPPIGAADYVLSDGDTICWFICCDYIHHPWN